MTQSRSIKGWEFHIDTEFMDEFFPINELSSASRANLLKFAKFENFPKGAMLSAIDETRWLIYVLRGTYVDVASTISGPMELADARDKNKKIQVPVFSDETEGEIEFTRESAIIKFERSTFKSLVGEDEVNNQHMKDISMTEAEYRIFSLVLETNQNRWYEVPAITENAVKVKNILNKFDNNSSLIADLIVNDPVLTASIIRYAGSYSSRVERITCLDDALSRLKPGQIKDLARIHAEACFFSDMDEPLKGMAKTIYAQGLCLANWCRVIAEKSGKLDSNTAFLAGLLHNVGGLVVLDHVKDNLNLFSDEDEIWKSTEKLTPVITPMVLSRWNFNPRIVQAAESVIDFVRVNSEGVDYGDVIIAANWCQHLVDLQISDIPEMKDVASFRKLGLEYLSVDEIKTMKIEVKHSLNRINELISIDAKSA